MEFDESALFTFYLARSLLYFIKYYPQENFWASSIDHVITYLQSQLMILIDAYQNISPECHCIL